jgi:hypothetical protein
MSVSRTRDLSAAGSGGPGVISVIRNRLLLAVAAASLSIATSQAAFISIVNLDTYQGGVPTAEDLAGVALYPGQTARLGILIELLDGTISPSGAPNGNRVYGIAIGLRATQPESKGLLHVSSLTHHLRDDAGRPWGQPIRPTAWTQYLTGVPGASAPFLESYRVSATTTLYSPPVGNSYTGNHTFLLDELQVSLEPTICNALEVGIAFDLAAGAFLAPPNRPYGYQINDSLGHGGDSAYTGGYWIARNGRGHASRFSIEVVVPQVDCNNNGEFDVCDIGNGISADCQGNGVPDECELAGNDCNGSSVPDDCEPDCNANGAEDGCDIAAGTSDDCNLNGVPDECEVEEFARDCNQNGTPDPCDIGSGASADANGDGVPDECRVLRVRVGAAADGNGLTWAAAVNDLAAALELAASSNGVVKEVWVAAGTYVPDDPSLDDPREASFQLHGAVGLYGGFAGHETIRDQRDSTQNVTILSGDRHGNDGPGHAGREDNCYRVIEAVQATGAAVLDGFLITGGEGGPGAGLRVLGNVDMAVRNCTFFENRAAEGGALFCGRIRVGNCRFLGNGKTPDATDGRGGAVYGPGRFVNCVFSGNYSDRGGAIYTPLPLLVYNSTFSANAATDEGSAMWIGGSNTSHVFGSIFWNNPTAGHPALISSIASHALEGTYLSHSLIELLGDETSSTATIAGNPRFRDAAGPDGVPGTLDDDFRLSPGSPCIDAGHVESDFGDIDEDGDPEERLPFDIDGNPRVFDDPWAHDTGFGQYPQVDMGAYERSAQDIDCNLNGIPDSVDIANGTSADADSDNRLDECTILRIKPGAGGNATGLTWDDAFESWEEAVEVAVLPWAGSGEVWFAAGVHLPPPPAGGDPRLASFFLVEDLAFYGGFAGHELTREQRDPAFHVTILSGDLAGNDGPDFAGRSDNAYHVVQAQQVGPTAVLDGFTLRGGNATTAPIDHRNGGGILVSHASPTLRNLTIERNQAFWGGGLFIIGPADVTALNCRFLGNSATSSGGAAAVLNAQPDFANCIMSGNFAAQGGALVSMQASPTIVSSTIMGNHATNTGGGLRIIGESATPLIANSILWGNTRTAAYTADEASQVDVFSGTPTLWHSHVQGWTGVLGGPGNSGLDPLVTAAPDRGGDAWGSGNNDFFGDLTLQTDSPCIDAGDNNLIPLDLTDADFDGDTAELLPIDVAGLPRRVDDPAVADSGAGDAPIVDVGAHERQAVDVTSGACCVPDDGDSGGACAVVADAAACSAMGFVCDVADHLPPSFAGCYGDADGNGPVNAGDRGFIAAAIGRSDAVSVCRYDMDGNGQINAGDRGFVSAAIGQCLPLPDGQNGSGQNQGAADGRFEAPTFLGPGTTCETSVCP